jgi:hypothetical protein
MVGHGGGADHHNIPDACRHLQELESLGSLAQAHLVSEEYPSLKLRYFADTFPLERVQIRVQQWKGGSGFGKSGFFAAPLLRKHGRYYLVQKRDSEKGAETPRGDAEGGRAECAPSHRFVGWVCQGGQLAIIALCGPDRQPRRSLFNLHPSVNIVNNSSKHRSSLKGII